MNASIRQHKIPLIHRMNRFFWCPNQKIDRNGGNPLYEQRFSCDNHLSSINGGISIPIFDYLRVITFNQHGTVAGTNAAETIAGSELCCLAFHWRNRFIC